MEVGLIIAMFVMSALSALCSVAALTILLVTAPKEEGENVHSPAEEKVEKPPDVEKRRRQAVQARQHSNFMDYDGTPQQPIDPSLILADGG